MNSRSDEYFEGKDAFYEGYSDLDNPYESGTEQAMDWDDGYRDAEDNPDTDDE